jgi:hypothetical protein
VFANPASTIAGHVTQVIAGLRVVLAAYMAKADHARPQLLLLWKRIAFLNRRIATLAERFAAGRNVTPRKRLRPPAETAASPGDRLATPARLRLPNKPGWLITQAIQFACYAEQFRHLLDDPEMIALLDAAPQIKRHLRPILRLLTLELPPSLALPPRPPRPPRVKPPRAPRPKKPRRAPCHGARRPKEFWRPGPIRPHWTA